MYGRSWILNLSSRVDPNTGTMLLACGLREPAVQMTAHGKFRSCHTKSAYNNYSFFEYENL
eukprot:SAG31_NODE_21222_length_554_cov_5.305495_2_plen_60_part_01